MRICFLLCQGNMYSGGQGVYLYYITRELARLGHEVEAIVGPPYPELAEGVCLHRVPSYSRYWLKETDREFFPGRPALEAFQPLNFYELATSLSGMFSVMAAFSIRAYERFNDLSRKRPFHLVHDNQVLGYGTLLIKATGIPVVATVHHPLSIDRESRVREAPSLWGKAHLSALPFTTDAREIMLRRAVRSSADIPGADPRRTTIEGRSFTPKAVRKQPR